jgi:hypothetical protein
MSDLAALRDGHDEVQEGKAVWLRNLSIADGVASFQQLYAAFEVSLRQTAPLFEPDRRRHLIELQARLRRLAEWQGSH